MNPRLKKLIPPHPLTYFEIQKYYQSIICPKNKGWDTCNDF